MPATRPASGIAPYWTRLPSFLLYPFSVEPLLVCVGLALLASFAAMMFAPLSSVLSIVVFVSLMRYGFFVLERTARGFIDDTHVLFDSAHGGKNLPYKQVAVALVGGTLCAIAGALGGPNAAWLSLGLLAMLWPANTMVLALDNDLGESLNPARLWEIASRIGVPYLGLCACLLLIFFSGNFLQGFLAHSAPHALIVPLASFASCLSTIAMFRMMGYVLYQYHEELGHEVKIGFEEQAGFKLADPRAARAARIAELLGEGRGEEALSEARDAAREAPADFEVQARLHRLLGALPGHEKALADHARLWLPALLGARRGSQALEVFEAVRERDPDFLPANADDRLPLADAAFKAHHFAAVKSLIKGFDRLFPGHRDIPSIYLLGARLLLEQGRDEEQAERILKALQNHYPQHPVALEAAKLLELAARLRRVG
jgi:tetratricopeptide (TPR) repeat protein